jgi:DNA-binding NarL/FixJ family response regulator
MTKILLADDHAMMRDGLRAILEKASYEVVGEAANGRDAVELTRQLRPDVVVMDISMPELNGVDAARQITGEHRDVKVIGLSMNTDRRYVVAMFAAGAAGYLLKDGASSELVRAIQTVLKNQTYVSPSVAGGVIASVRETLPPATPRHLSTREREVLQLLAEGKTSKDIATALGIALPTVETHRRQIMAKVGIRTIAELTKYAIREGITMLEK